MTRRTAILTLVVLSGCAPDDVSPMFGGACMDNSECAAPAMCLPPGASTPSGFCTILCEKDSDCDPSAACAMVPELGVTGGVCLLSCRDNRDCEILRSDGQDEAWICQQQNHVSDGTRFVCLGG